MPHDLNTPRVVIASGMTNTGVSTVTKILQDSAPSVRMVDGGCRWTDIIEACTPGFARLMVVTTHDIVSMSSAYALIKLVRDRFPDAQIEVLVNRSEERDALKAYERIQGAASHFLGEMIGYAGSVPDALYELDERSERAGVVDGVVDGAVDGASSDITSAVAAAADASVSDGGIAVNGRTTMALRDLATRLDDELVPTTAGRRVMRNGERRMAS